MIGFSDAYLDVSTVIIVSEAHTGDGAIKTLADMDGRDVGVLTAAVFDAQTKSICPTRIRITIA